jgi:hypothetical protein
MAQIAGYRYRLNGGGIVDFVVDVGLTRPHTFTGLTPATSYLIEVQDYDADGLSSAWSTVVEQTTASEGGGGGFMARPIVAVDEDGAAWVDGGGGVVTIYG